MLRHKDCYGEIKVVVTEIQKDYYDFNLWNEKKVDLSIPDDCDYEKTTELICMNCKKEIHSIEKECFEENK